MTKKQLIEELSLSSDLANGTKAEASRVLELVAYIITKALQKGEDVDWSGFAKFKTVIQPEKRGKVPGTDKTYVSPQKRVVKIKPTAKLKNSIAAS